jgi:hypothetical protein
MPRASTSPSASQAAMNGVAQQNGIPLVNGLPSGGQQTDMNHLWSVVQQLSQLLEENKAQTAGVLNGVAALQARAAEEGDAMPSSSQVNGELSGASPSLNRQYTLETPGLQESSNSVLMSRSSESKRRTHRPPIPHRLPRILPLLIHRPHALPHLPNNRLRKRAHPPPRQTASLRIHANLLHPRLTQALPDTFGKRARNKHAAAARALGVAGGLGQGG